MCVDTAYFDFAKALFDRVCHDYFVYKLKKYGINYLYGIKYGNNYLSNQTQVVEVKGYNGYKKVYKEVFLVRN